MGEQLKKVEGSDFYEDMGGDGRTLKLGHGGNEKAKGLQTKRTIHSSIEDVEEKVMLLN